MTPLLRRETPATVTDVTGHLWTLGRCLGRGGFAKVYECEENEAVVVKVFRTRQSYVNELFAYQSLFSDARRVAHVTRRGMGHLGVPVLHAHGHGKTSFIVIQKLFPVKQLMEESFRDNNVVMMIVQLLDVLEFMHKSRWTHNDIKYDNIMVDACRNFYLIDFGLVSSFATAVEEPTNRPIVGTSRYMSLDAHRGMVNSPRGDLANLAFVIKLLLTTPWDIEQHAVSLRTALLIEKEAWAADPECGPFTDFCRSVFTLEYADTPDYKKLKTLLPSQPKVAAVRKLYVSHCRFTPPGWIFATIFQAHILPYLYRLSRKLHALKRLKPSVIGVEDLLFILDANHTRALTLDGLGLLGEPTSRYTREAGVYITMCVEFWIAHTARELRKLVETHRMPVGAAIHRLSQTLRTAHP